MYAIHMGGCECQLTHREEWDVIVSSWWSLFGGGGSESESESAPPPPPPSSEDGGPVYCIGWQMLSTTRLIKA